MPEIIPEMAAHPGSRTKHSLSRGTGVLKVTLRPLRRRPASAGHCAVLAVSSIAHSSVAFLDVAAAEPSSVVE